MSTATNSLTSKAIQMPPDCNRTQCLIIPKARNVFSTSRLSSFWTRRDVAVETWADAVTHRHHWTRGDHDIMCRVDIVQIARSSLSTDDGPLSRLTKHSPGVLIAKRLELIVLGSETELVEALLSEPTHDLFKHPSSPPQSPGLLC